MMSSWQMGLICGKMIFGKGAIMSQTGKKRRLLIENTEIVADGTKMSRIGIKKSHSFSSF
jgi:hypothetical protein